MSELTQQWLRQQVKTLPAVRAVFPVTNSETDLLVRTWVGMSVNIYFLDGEPNLRALKRLLQENTRTYQASLLIVRETLMPPDKTRLIPDEWLRVLHELNSERIYTYVPGKIGIGQIHFDYMPDGIEREVWYGGMVEFEKLRVLDVNLRARAMRGQYKMADFGPNPYWRASEYRSERLRARFRRGPQDFVFNRYDVGGMPGGADEGSLQRAHMGELERQLDVLGLGLDATREQVKAAFRKLAREYHPDTSKLDEASAAERFREINVAYEYIKSKQRWQ